MDSFRQNASLFRGSYRMTRSAYTDYEKIGVLFQEVHYPLPIDIDLGRRLDLQPLPQENGRIRQIPICQMECSLGQHAELEYEHYRSNPIYGRWQQHKHGAFAR